MKDDTLLYRQVHPNFVRAGHFTSQAFRPSEADGKLSTYDGSRISAESSWNHYTNTLGRASSGVAAVTVADCRNLDLAVVPDGRDFPEHTSIDFSQAGSKTQKFIKAKMLHAAAEVRGWQFRP